MPTRADRIISPGRNAASEIGADAIVLDPANVGHLPAPEFRWTGVACTDAPKRVGCGHAFEIATPVIWGLGTGLRVDYVQTPASAGFPYNGYDYTWITWALGYKLSDSLAFGGSLQRSYSVDSYLNGLWGVTASLSFHPGQHLGLAMIAHDFNGPSTQALPPRALPVLDQSYVMAAAFRPTGRRGLEVGLDLRYLQGSEQFIPRASLQIDIPGIGRARGDFEVAHLPNQDRRGVVGTAGLEISFGGVAAGGGVLFGSGLGKESSVGAFGTVSIAGYSNPSSSVPRPERAVYLRIEKTPGPRGHIGLLRKLWRLADDREVSAVTLVLRTEPASSFAHAEELADAVRVLKARGKKVLCSFEDNGAKALYVCANADRIVMNPAGGVRYAGIKTQHLYLAGLLSKLGVKADILRISDHKTAPEQFTNEHASDTARADQERLLRNYEAVFNKNLAVGRHVSEEHVRAATLQGPFVATEARDARLVDGFAFDDEIERVTGELVGHPVKLEKYAPEERMPQTFGPRGRVGLLLIDGDMIDGRSSHIPLIDMDLVGSYTIAENVRQLKDDPTVRSVVLRIESPGGSSMGADVMWRELALLAKKKPLIVSMGSVAASGGYYIAAPARTIYALPLTVTGSIGIFYGKADVSELLKKLGVNVEVRKTAPRADAESFFRPFSDEERVALRIKIQQFYDVFLDRVSLGRHMSKADVDAVGQGRVWTGQEALDHKLVDKMGGLREAMVAAREAGGLPYDAPVLDLPVKEETLLDKALDLAGLHAGAMMSLDGLPVQVKDLARGLAPMVTYRGDVPMARMDWVDLDDVGDED
jgi:protease-4